MNREILSLAVPNVVSNITVPLLSTVDTLLMGRLSAAHIGAVGLGAMIFNFIYWSFGFLRMGTTGITAQAYGKNDPSAMMLTLGRSMLIAFVLAALVIASQYPIGEMSWYLMNVQEGQQDLVRTYFYIRIWAAPATLGLYALLGWFFGMQNAIVPLGLTVLINVVNMLLSYYFVQFRGMEVAGVAYGTVIAQYVGFFAAIIIFFLSYSDLWSNFNRKLWLHWGAFKKFLQINADIFLRTIFLTLAYGYFYSQSSANGELALAANVILLNFLHWMSYGIDGFAYASESLVGKYAGAQDPPKLKLAIRLTFVWGMGLAFLYSLVYGFLGYPILAIFTNQVDVIEATIPFLFWMAIFPLLSAPCYLWDGVFVGLTASKAMLYSMFLAFVLYIITSLSLKEVWGNHGLWAALLIFMISRGAIQQWLFGRMNLERKYGKPSHTFVEKNKL